MPSFTNAWRRSSGDSDFSRNRLYRHWSTNIPLDDRPCNQKSDDWTNMGKATILLFVLSAAGGATLLAGDSSLSQVTDGGQTTAKAAKSKVAVWTQFEMNRSNASGGFLWTAPENWTKGIPSSDLCVEIGDDHSRQALHCVIPARCNAVCQHFELAEHGRTQGTTLRLERCSRLTILESGVLSKDRESTFFVDGTLRCPKAKGGLRIGGPWGRPDIGEPASCSLLIGPSGVVDAWHIGVNTSHRADSAPSSPWGPRFYARSTDSEIVVDGGTLVARNGLRMSTTDAERPPVLRLKGKATFSSDRESEYGIDVWCGIWEIEGGDANINVGDVEFWGNKFYDAVNPKNNTRVGSGLAELKLSGNGVSTIHARNVNFVDAAVLDVSSLKVRAGTYKIIDGSSFRGRNLRFASGTDEGKWSIRFDEDQADVFLTLKP